MTASPEWISGHRLARGASVLIHDAQYADREYGAHPGWGHSCLGDALTFARRSEARHVVLFHHDPEHDDVRLEGIGEVATQRWAELGNGTPIEMAREGRALELGPQPPP